MLQTLDYTIRIASTPTILYFDLYLYSTYAAHYVYIYRTRIQAHGNGFCSSVGRVLVYPWSCIFRNLPRLGLKMYIFLTLDFTFKKHL